MKRIIDPLTQMGARIQAREGQFPPLEIEGSRLRPIQYELPIASAQVKSCILLAGLTAAGITTVVEPVQSRDHTERALSHFGATLSRQGNRLSVDGPARLTGQVLEVPGDFSSAVFFIVAALLLPGSRVRIANVGINPTRTGLLDLLQGAGAPIRKCDLRTVAGEPRCDLEIEYDRAFLERFPGTVQGHWIPNVIDEIPILAVMGTQLPGGLTIADAAELRKKESDRIHSIVWNLRELGIEVDEHPDGFRVKPGQTVKGGLIRTSLDHRIAMAFSVAGLLSTQGVTIDHPECADVSFPQFYSTLASISG